MKFLVSSGTLLRELQSIAGVLSNNNSLPILDNFLFEIKQNQLTVTASDLETTMMATLEIESKETGVVCVPAKLILEILKTMADQPLTFSVNMKLLQIEISSEYGKYKLAGYEGDEYPRTPNLENSGKISIRGDILARAINKTIFAAANDDLRPVMSGIYCQFTEDDCTFVCTDAHKLVRYKRKDVKADNAASFILPKKPVNLIKNIVSGAEIEAEISYSPTNASFTFANIRLICLLIDGKYPNYEAVIPQENPNKLLIDRSLFLNSVKRASIFANKTTYQVRLKITGSELVISAEDIDYANEANERLTCNYVGEDMEIGFNSRFLVDILSNLECKEVSLEMSTPSRAGIIVPADPERENEDMLMLVMPVMLNN